MIRIGKNNVSAALADIKSEVFIALTVIERHHVNDMNPLFYDYFGFLPVFNSEEEAKSVFPDARIVSIKFEP